jgi:hypothetical protein
LEQYERLNGKEAKELFVDRGIGELNNTKPLPFIFPNQIKILPKPNEQSIAKEQR